MMKMRLSYKALLDLIKKQLKSLLLFNSKIDTVMLEKELPKALIRSEHCFSCCRNKYYWNDGAIYFSPFHSGQYSIFLYFLSHGIGNSSGGIDLADRLYYLNKIMNAVDIYHAVSLPDVFDLDHPLGSVMGRAKYSNYFMFMQNCTVGNNKGIYPELGEYVTLFSGAKILGNCRIGTNVILASNTFVLDEHIPDNSIVFGSSPHLEIKEMKSETLMENKARWYNLKKRDRSL